ncbi:hypothetical protein ACIG0D_33985 [Streptomyces sp. NPDC052773]|uniref:hypothetical protein n=1 Tax=Streptomyces sp. NPDC052773 TaxID=3365693 RepID=UPI0037D216E0
MATARPHTVQITLATDEVRLISAVLRQAVVECSAATSPDTGLDEGVTLGRLAARWADLVAERSDHEDEALGLDGSRLLTVPQSREAWYQVRAALSDHAAQVSRDAHLVDFPAPDSARARAHDALLLADRIAEAAHGW